MDVEKLPEAKAIYKNWFRRLNKGALYSEIADWLNASGIPVGKNCRTGKWNCAMVGRVTHNWLLKGVRFRNKRHSKRHNASGKYITEKADPCELLVREVPHLAFFKAPYYDRVVAKADARNAKYRRTNCGGPDPCQYRPKKRVRFPGQTMYCGICGRGFVFGGNGLKDHLICADADEYECWNGFSVNGPLAAQIILDAVHNEAEVLPDFEPAFLELVNDEVRQRDGQRNAKLREVLQKVSANDRELANLMKFIRAGDDSQSVRADLKQLEQQKLILADEQLQLDREPRNEIVIPSASELKQMIQEAFKNLPVDDFEFAKRLRAVTGNILVWPFQCINGTGIVPRAKFTLQLTNLIADAQLRDALQKPLERVIAVDLFEPPEPVKWREEVVLRRKSATQRTVASALGITVTAAQQAAGLDRLMRQGTFDSLLATREATGQSVKVSASLALPISLQSAAWLPS